MTNSANPNNPAPATANPELSAEQIAAKDLAARLDATTYDAATVVRTATGAIECIVTDTGTRASRPAGFTPVAKSPFNRAMYARIDAEMGDSIPFKPGAVISLEDAIKAALAGIDRLHAEQLLLMIGNPTAEERDTWARKLMAAINITNGEPTENDVLVLQKGAAKRDFTLEEFAAVIIGKDKAYATVIDQADEFREGARNAVTACSSTEEVGAVGDALKEQMQAAVAALMAAEA